MPIEKADFLCYTLIKKRGSEVQSDGLVSIAWYEGGVITKMEKVGSSIEERENDIYVGIHTNSYTIKKQIKSLTRRWYVSHRLDIIKYLLYPMIISLHKKQNFVFYGKKFTQ